jgi:hypothetical protein
VIRLRIEIPVNPLSRQWRREALERELGSCAYERDEDEFSLCYKLGWIGPSRYSRFAVFDLVRLDEDPARGTATLTLEVRRFLLIPAGFALLLLCRGSGRRTGLARSISQ